MYIWVGIDVDGQLSDVRECAAAVEGRIGAEHSCYTLPMHVSLKMSFPMGEDMAAAVIGDLERYFERQKPFTIHVKGVECEGPIVWIRMERSKELDLLHDKLNAMLLEHYGVALHEYDTDYKFHTTLYMGSDEGRVRSAYESLAALALPKALTASRFVIGTSESGALGTYSVIKTVCI